MTRPPVYVRAMLAPTHKPVGDGACRHPAGGHRDPPLQPEQKPPLCKGRWLAQQDGGIVTYSM